MKNLLIYIFVSVFTINSYSQINLQTFTSEQNIIYEATDSVLFIVRQDYVLKDTKSGAEYGRGGKEYFGRTYGIAVLSDNKLWCEKKVKMPWLTDINYSQYRSIDSIQPVLSKTAIRAVSEKQFTEIELQQLSVTSYDSLLNKLSIANLSLKNPLPGITNQIETRDNEGWIVIVYTNDDISTNESCDVQSVLSGYKSNKFS